MRRANWLIVMTRTTRNQQARIAPTAMARAFTKRTKTGLSFATANHRFATYAKQSMAPALTAMAPALSERTNDPPKYTLNPEVFLTHTVPFTGWV